NGHHHLYYYLNLSKLIEEPKDLDYFSPWRDSPRPLRGIYHAYFTFFWAYKLFRDIIINKDQEQNLHEFTKVEWKKIYSRAVEEYHKLNFSSDRKSTRLNSSHVKTSYAVFCLKRKNGDMQVTHTIDQMLVDRASH